MASESQLMSELSHKTHYLRELTEEESKQLKAVIFNIYKDVAKLCDKHHLTYMMSGGTCLGAIRHHGFIPWDDDLDIMMPRKDYNQLIELLRHGELGNKYEFTCPSPDSDANTVFLKIFRSLSLDVEIQMDNTPFPKGIFLDVFAIDAVPKTKFFQIIKGVIANALQYAAMCRLMVQYPSGRLKEYMYLDNALKKRYKRKIALGRLVSFASHAKWVFWFDRFVSSDKENHPWGIPTGRKYYNGEIFDKSIFVPVSKAMFEGVEVNVPHKPHIYLTNLYKNCMELPPVEKRERHFICEFQLPDEI